MAKTIDITELVVRDAHQSLMATRMAIPLVLEAMTMETNITAPLEGKVKAFTVNAGDSVKANQIVVEFE